MLTIWSQKHMTDKWTKVCKTPGRSDSPWPASQACHHFATSLIRGQENTPLLPLSHGFQGGLINRPERPFSMDPRGHMHDSTALTWSTDTTTATKEAHLPDWPDGPSFAHHVPSFWWRLPQVGYLIQLGRTGHWIYKRSSSLHSKTHNSKGKKSSWSCSATLVVE